MIYTVVIVGFIILYILHLVAVSLSHTMKKLEDDFYKAVPHVTRTTAQRRAENNTTQNKFAQKRFTVLHPTDTLGKVLNFRGKHAKIVRGDSGDSDC